VYPPKIAKGHRFGWKIMKI